METARILRTDPQTEQSLVFVEHIRLRCQICGVIVQPSDLERTLWADDICPLCNRFNMVKQSDDFDAMLRSKSAAIGNGIKELQDKINELRSEYDSLIEEADQFCSRFGWLSKSELNSAKNWRDIDFLF